MTKQRTQGERSFAERFEDVDDEVPMTNEEASAVLKEAGLNASDGLKRLLGELEAVEDRERAERFAKAEVSLREERARMEGRSTNLSRPELLQQLELYKKQHPGLSAHFRNFQSASDAELRSLLVEIEELTGSGKK